MYDKLVSTKLGADYYEIIHTRIADMFTPFEVYSESRETIEAFKIRKTLRKHDSRRVLKTWVNSWATSRRYHEAVQLPCLFGCKDGVDKQSHYLGGFPNFGI